LFFSTASSDANWEIVGRGVFTIGGKPDILWRNLGTGQNALWYMNGITITLFVLLDSFIHGKGEEKNV
jgi:hypothetical protein